MLRMKFKVGDIVTLEPTKYNSRICQITETRHISSDYNNRKGYIKYTYKLLTGEKGYVDNFDEGCYWWNSNQIKKTPLLKAKLYE